MIDQQRLLRFTAFAAVAWVPAAIGAIAAANDAPGWVTIVLVVAGLVAAVALAARTSRLPRRLLVGTTAGASGWEAISNPDAEYANRWASYADFFTELNGRDWSNARVGEIGGSNEVLRAMLAGAQYRQLAYPEYDAQNLTAIADGSFDVVVLDQTLEHIPDPEKALREMHRVLAVGGIAIISTPFLVPVHEGTGYGDYYRWTPSGLRLVLDRCGFDADVRSWGNRPAASALLEDMYLKVTPARRAGLAVDVADTDPEFPVTVWAIAKRR